MVGQIKFDAAAQRFAAIETNRGVGKIGAGLPVPNAELHDVDFIPGGRDKLASKIAGKPARLQLQLGGRARDRQKRAFVDARARAHFRVTIGGVAPCHVEKVERDAQAKSPS